jgi:hypothetical protein
MMDAEVVCEISPLVSYFGEVSAENLWISLETSIYTGCSSTPASGACQWCLPSGYHVLAAKISY